MPLVKITTPGVSIELDCDEGTVRALGNQALDLFRKASEVHHRTPLGPAAGGQTERRGTHDHTDPLAPYGGPGFRPVKA